MSNLIFIKRLLDMNPFFTLKPESPAMKYLCLICAETVMEQMTESAARKHFEEYADFTEAIRKSDHYLA